jgi:hypothetical protein
MKPQRKPQPHAFAVPTVHEMPRPAEPAWFASTW